MIDKVIFHLEQDEDGFPPTRVELLNATSLGDGLFRVENTPFFTAGVSFNDVVRASPAGVNGQYRFEEVVEQSDFASLSIIILDQGMDTFLMDLFRGLKCVIEYGEFGVYRMLAVSVPPNVDYEVLRNQLQVLEDKGMLSFAELAVGE